MKIDSISKRIEELNIKENENYSSFILADYDIKNKTLNEVIPIENKVTNLEIDSDFFIVTDKEGNILLPNEEIEKYKIVYVNKDTIVISKEKEYMNQNKSIVLPKKIEKFKYDKETKELIVDNKIHESNKETLVKVYCPDSNFETILIKKIRKDKKNARLYSIKQNKYVTPEFVDLEETDYPGIFKFIDNIESNKELDGLKLNNTIIGYVNIKGKIHNQIFDENKNEIQEYNLNTITQYNELKKVLSKEIDNKIDIEIIRRKNKKSLVKMLENIAAKQNK